MFGELRDRLSMDAADLSAAMERQARKLTQIAAGLTRTAADMRERPTVELLANACGAQCYAASCATSAQEVACIAANACRMASTLETLDELERDTELTGENQD